MNAATVSTPAQPGGGAERTVEDALRQIDEAVTAIVDNLERVETSHRLRAARDVLDARKRLDRAGFLLIRACVRETTRDVPLRGRAAGSRARGATRLTGSMAARE